MGLIKLPKKRLAVSPVARLVQYCIIIKGEQIACCTTLTFLPMSCLANQCGDELELVDESLSLLTRRASSLPQGHFH